MNRKMVFNILGQIIMLEAALMLLPLIVCAIYREKSFYAFLITIGIALVSGGGLMFFTRRANRLIFAKEGFVIVALAWIAMSVIGALPFTLSGEIGSYIDALFETVSGFTTTGASVLTDVESLSHGIQFWRMFTHWVGGMGVLVFIMALVPSKCDRSIHIMRAEMPGPIIGKLVPTVKQTAKILYLIYIALTVFEAVFLLCGGMTLYESIVHSFATAGTGGFGMKATSVGGYSPYIQWVITVFMLLFGVNFNLYYLILIKKFRSVFKSAELWCYFIIVAVAVLLITFNVYSMYETLAETVRVSSFQVASIITTTGFSTVNFDAWPELSKGILFALMFTGACAGSTAGGLKISRVMLLFKMVRCELKRMLHPRSVSVIVHEGKRVDDATLNSTGVYFILYIFIYALVFFIISFERFDFETTFTAVAACYNNIGPGFGKVGPAGSFADFSVVSKIVLSLTMLLGRLELYPLLFTLTPSTWSDK